MANQVRYAIPALVSLPLSAWKTSAVSR
ncbi:hypothetical protein FH608_024400 [Nonomuraea phyllanthi]|uniref:Uncharacterized protein n=1 Tax=Nonomuraea phyllanthi TaxID=2219224 RepID=A0A5C4WC32_9ACTN|nr:hypothetical protein FH608_024400 [Nonomuraea phyllanthi]QFY14268.1 hypothetical protein GBF35_16775 [Nonomuraea phyllanthi]